MPAAADLEPAPASYSPLLLIRQLVSPSSSSTPTSSDDLPLTRRPFSGYGLDSAQPPFPFELAPKIKSSSWGYHQIRCCGNKEFIMAWWCGAHQLL